MNYYRFIIGSGFYQCYQFVVRTERSTTDYGGLTDILIDYLVEKGKQRGCRYSNILDLDNYEWDEEGINLIEKETGNIIYHDEFVEGGNCGDVLMHYGEFRIEEISETDLNEYDEIVEGVW